MVKCIYPHQNIYHEKTYMLIILQKAKEVGLTIADKGMKLLKLFCNSQQFICNLAVLACIFSFKNMTQHGLLHQKWAYD